MNTNLEEILKKRDADHKIKDVVEYSERSPDDAKCPTCGNCLPPDKE